MKPSIAIIAPANVTALLSQTDYLRYKSPPVLKYVTLLSQGHINTNIVNPNELYEHSYPEFLFSDSSLALALGKL